MRSDKPFSRSSPPWESRSRAIGVEGLVKKEREDSNLIINNAVENVALAKQGDCDCGVCNRCNGGDALDKFFRLAKDHYWDSLEDDKQTVFNHIESIVGMVRRQDNPVMYEDDLPKDITESEYNWWYERSGIVGGVRMGPRFIRVTERQ